MVSVLYVEINIFALSILFVTFISLRHRSCGSLTDSRLFYILLYSNAVSIIMDLVSFTVNGKPGAIAREISLIVNAGIYIFTSIIIILWCLYARYQVYRDVKKTRKNMIPLIIPASINILLTIISCFNGFYFFIGPDNHYHRGKGFIFFAIICVAYILYTEILIIRNKKLVTRKYFIPLVMFAVPPFIGGLLQIAFYGISLVWVGMAISALIIALNIQNDQLYTDHLTGLGNRRLLDRYLEECVRRNKRGLLAGVMIDLDFFKQINDRWGHSVGDEALIYASKILQMSFRRDDIICRYGGDEFIVIFRVEKEADLTEAVNRVKRNLEKFRERNQTPYNISFSVGYDIFDLKAENDVQQFLKRLDSLMYENKKRSRLL